jgi:hypothetical protein
MGVVMEPKFDRLFSIFKLGSVAALAFGALATCRTFNTKGAGREGTLNTKVVSEEGGDGGGRFGTMGPSQLTLDDSTITLKNASDIATRRTQLIHYLWGPAQTGLPGIIPTVPKNITSPLPGPFENLNHVEEWDVTMTSGNPCGTGCPSELSCVNNACVVKGRADHYVPSLRKNGRLVVVHAGHGYSFSDSPYMLDRLIKDLVYEGYGVLAVYMPRYTPDQASDNGVRPSCSYGASTGVNRPHCFLLKAPVAGGANALKFFFETTLAGINYAQTLTSGGSPVYTNFNMFGISGGGWTTQVYAALDTRVALSASVAGGQPLYFPTSNPGEAEQIGPSTNQPGENFYNLAGYPDLYVMSSYGRRHEEILNAQDHDCCFGRPQYNGTNTYDADVRKYEMSVRNALFNIGQAGSPGTNSGFFRMEIDEAATTHQISDNARINVLLSALNQARRYENPIDTNTAFVRGLGTDLWDSSGWAPFRDPSGDPFRAAGTPGSAAAGTQRFAFYRDATDRNNSNRLTFTVQATPGGVWSKPTALPSPKTADLGASDGIITDPVALGTSWGRWDVVAIDSLNHVCIWSKTTPAVFCDHSGVLAVGPPALVGSGSQGSYRIDVIFRLHDPNGFFTGNTPDRTLQHWFGTSPDSLTAENLGGITVNFPAGIMHDGSLNAFARGRSGGLYEVTPAVGGGWQWNSVSALANNSTALSGSPSVWPTPTGNFKVFSRSADGNLMTFTSTGQTWSAREDFAGTGRIDDSPAAVGSGAFTRDSTGALWFFDGTTFLPRGGLFE